MNRTIALTALMAVAVLGASCSQPLQPRPWNQIHSDKGNTGFNPIHGAYAEALNKKWTASVGKLAFSSPVVGPDGTVYVGNVIGQAVAINPDGTERWRRQLGSSIVATPAVHIETGEILFVVQNPLNARDYASFLYRLSPGGNILAVSTDQDLATTSAPKIWREYVFLQTGVRYPRRETIAKGYIRVFDRSTLQLVATGSAWCGHPLCAGGSPFDWFSGLVDFLGCVVQFNPLDVCFPPDIPLGPKQEPSLAIVDAATAVGDPAQPIVVATTGFCASAFRFSPLAAVDQRLQHLWGQKLVGDCDDPIRCTSPAVIVGTQAVFGDEKGRVKSLDVLTGAEFWKVDFDRAVQAPPVAFLRQIYLVMEDRLIVLDSDGSLLHNVPFQGYGQMAALSLEYVYVATTAGIYTFRLNPEQGSTFDASSASPGGVWVWEASGLALAGDGTLYVSTPDGSLHAYGQVQAKRSGAPYHVTRQE